MKQRKRLVDNEYESRQQQLQQVCEQMAFIRLPNTKFIFLHNCTFIILYNTGYQELRYME